MAAIKRALQLALLLMGLAWCAPAHAVITLSQTVKVCTGSSPLACTITATGTGHDICVGTQGNPNTATISGVTDSATETYTQMSGARSTDSTGGNFADLWCFPNAASGVTTVTATCPSCNASNLGMAVYEIAGAVTSSIAAMTDVSGAVTNGAACTSCVGPNTTTTATGSLILLAWGAQQSFTAAGGTGFVDDGAGVGGGRFSHNITTATVNMNTGTATTASGTYNVSGTSIKAAAAGASAGFDKRRRYEQADE